MEKLNAAQRDSQEKDQKCSKLEDDMYDMQKKMAASRDDYEQQQELLEKLQQKSKYILYCDGRSLHVECVLIVAAQTKLASDVTTQVDLTADGEYLYIVQLCISLYMHTVIVIHEYKTKLTASETKLTASETDIDERDEKQG